MGRGSAELSVSAARPINRPWENVNPPRPPNFDKFTTSDFSVPEDKSNPEANILGGHPPRCVENNVRFVPLGHLLGVVDG